MMTSRDPMVASHHASSGYSFPFLDGLRGLAILSVVICHTPVSSSFNVFVRAITALTFAGSFGLSIFFVISGFLISLAVFKIQQPRQVISYALRRIGKIVPPFYLSVLIFAVIWMLWGRSDAVVAAVAYLTTTAHFWMGSFGWFNPPCWSLFIEMHFYFFLPLIYFLLRTTPFSKIITWLSFFIIPPFFRWLHSYSQPLPFTEWFAEYNLMPNALDYFSWGILFAILFEHYKTTNLRFLGGALADSGLIILSLSCLFTAYFRFRIVNYSYQNNYLPFIDFEISRYLAGASSFLLLFIAFNPTCFSGRLFLFKPLRYIGLVSYEWYLLHFPIIEIFGEMLGDPRHRAFIFVIRAIVPWIVSLGLASLTYHFFSLPVLNWFKGMAKMVELRKS